MMQGERGSDAVEWWTVGGGEKGQTCGCEPRAEAYMGSSCFDAASLLQRTDDGRRQFPLLQSV